MFDGNTWQDRLNEPGAWVPTFPGPGEGKYPRWGEARALAITEDQKYVSLTPIMLSIAKRKVLFSIMQQRCQILKHQFS